MKFKVGDKVKEIRGFKQIGKVVEAEKDETWATGERYLIDFGKYGNGMSDGTDFELLEKSR